MNIGVVEKLDVTDRTVALEMLQGTGIRDVLVIVEILNFFKTFDDELLSALMNTYDTNADGKESVLYRVVEVVLKNRHETKSQESEPKWNATVECSNRNAVPIPDNRQGNDASDVLDRPSATETVSNTLSQQILDSKTSCVEKMPSGTEVLCVISEPVNLEHCAKEIPKTNNTSSTIASDAAIVTIAASKPDRVAILSSVEHPDVTSSCGGTELQLTALGPCDRSDDTKVLEPMELTGSPLSRSTELSNTRQKITNDSEMLEAESTQKQMRSGAAEEIAAAAVSDADLKLIFEKHLCGSSSEAANALNSKEHSSSDNSGDSQQEVQPLSSASAVDSLTPNDEVSCAKDNSACVAVSLANSLLPPQKLPEVERSKPKKILLPTPKLLPSMSRPDFQPLMALHDPPRLQAPACFLGPDEAPVRPHIPPHLLFSQRSPSRPLSSMPCPRSFSGTKVLLPSPDSISVPRFQFPNEEPSSIVQLEPVSRPLLAHRTPLLRLPPHEATSRSSHQAPVLRRALLPTPNMSLTETLTVGSQPFVGSFHPLKRQIPQQMIEGLGPPPFKRFR